MTKEIVEVRIKNQHLVTPAFEQAGELVNWMGAIQAQDYSMVKWAVGLRLKKGSLAAVDEALRRGVIVGNWVKTVKKGQITFTTSFFEQKAGFDPGLVKSAEEEFLRFSGKC